MLKNTYPEADWPEHSESSFYFTPKVIVEMSYVQGVCFPNSVCA